MEVKGVMAERQYGRPDFLRSAHGRGAGNQPVCPVQSNPISETTADDSAAMEMACLEAGGEWVEVRRSEQVGKYKAKEPEGLLAVVVRLHSIIRRYVSVS